jgi:RNA polymerase sigma factor (sigma-70 family)
MPRTERGAAICKPRPQRLLPITERDRRDARFLNSLSRPQRPATPRGQKRDEPRFDKNRFIAVISQDYTQGFGGKNPYEQGGKYRAGVPGWQLPATCEGASCGGDVSAKSTAKFGSTSYEHLIGKARRPLNLVAATITGAPPGLSRFFVVALVKHKSKYFRPHKVEHDDGTTTIEHVLFVRHNGRKLRYIRFPNWFGQNYPWRWDQPASSYVDIRIDGKASNSADLTWPQAAARADDAFDFFSTRPKPSARRKELTDCHRCFYETPVLGFFWLWLNAAIDAEQPSRRYIPAHIYRKRMLIGYTVSQLVRLKELGNSPRLGRYLAECFRQLAKTVERPRAITERDKIIAKFWFLAKKKCRGRVPRRELADAVMACMERITKTFDDSYKPERGAFAPYAEQAIDWAIQDFMKELRRQVPVQRSINVDDPAPDSDDDVNTPPEQPDMMRIDSLGTQAAEAKRRLVAERLDCLNWRERRVIEGTLGLNGYRHPVSAENLADELDLSAKQIGRIAKVAAEKLQESVLGNVRNPAPDRIYR